MDQTALVQLKTRNCVAAGAVLLPLVAVLVHGPVTDIRAESARFEAPSPQFQAAAMARLP